MKYHISRNLSFGRKPCAEAFRDSYTRVDLRMVASPEHIPAFAGSDGNWFHIGERHMNSPQTISRHLKDSDWFVNIDNLADFIAKYGAVKVRRCIEDDAPNAMEIEILDEEHEL